MRTVIVCATQGLRGENKGGKGQCLRLADEELSYRGMETCPRSHGKSVVELGAEV